MGSESFGSRIGSAPAPGGMNPALLAAQAAAKQGPSPESVHAEIDDALATLADLEQVPLAEQVGRFDQVHATLTEALATIDRI